ncbi:hypothetical protein [Bradyrhizobium ganzhouense]|uniref:hypothetical protein n=1 Tax=Bradyrhizobium ganzhouense TaxID=1179767 RepID=UPI003CF23BE8
MRRGSGIEEALEICRLAEDANTPFARRLPFDEGEQADRIAFKNPLISVDVIQNGRGDRKHHARRIEAAFPPERNGSGSDEGGRSELGVEHSLA